MLYHCDNNRLRFNFLRPTLCFFFVKFWKKINYSFCRDTLYTRWWHTTGAVLPKIVKINLNILPGVTSRMDPDHPTPIVFCGPSGSGKSTLVKKMMEEYPDRFGFSVSHTTRKPRPIEVDGQHYHFITETDFKKAIEEGKFIEHATFSGNLYGTSKNAVDSVRNSGKVCILDIDIQGVRQIMQNGDFKPWFIFVEPPSLEALEARLRARNTETEESLAQRLKVAEEELIFGKTPGNFHLIITNDEFEHAYAKLKEFLTEYVLSSGVAQRPRELNGVSYGTNFEDMNHHKD